MAIPKELTWQKERLENRYQLIDSLITDDLKASKELSRPYVASTATQGRSALLQNLLQQLAQDSDLEPPSFPLGLSDRTVDYLLRLVVHPYTTSPDHPALVKSSNSKAKSKGSFEVYMRYRDSPVEDELTNLKRFISVYEGYQITLQHKIDYLEVLKRDAELDGKNAKDIQTYTRYFGQIIRTDAAGRLAEDLCSSSLPSAPPILVQTHMKRFEGAFESYEFVDLRRNDSATSTTALTATESASRTWLTRPDLWNLEYIVVLAGALGSMNSAPGGIPQVNFSVPPQYRGRFPLTSSPLPMPPSDASTTQAVISHYLRARRFYQTLGADGVNRGVLSREATMAQAQGAATQANATLLLGKEITMQDATTGSTFWSIVSGPGLKLFQKLADIVCGMSNPQVLHSFADLWCVTTAQTDPPPPLACVFPVRPLYILQPKIIGVMSSVVSDVLENARFDLVLGDPDCAAFLNLELSHQKEFKEVIRISKLLEQTWRNIEHVDPWMMRSGDVRVVSVTPHRGFVDSAPIQQSCLVVTMLDPGCFVYNLAYQRLLYPVYLLQLEFFYNSRSLVLTSPTIDSA